MHRLPSQEENFVALLEYHSLSRWVVKCCHMQVTLGIKACTSQQNSVQSILSQARGLGSGHETTDLHSSSVVHMISHDL